MALEDAVCACLFLAGAIILDLWLKREEKLNFFFPWSLDK